MARFERSSLARLRRQLVILQRVRLLSPVSVRVFFVLSRRSARSKCELAACVTRVGRHRALGGDMEECQCEQRAVDEICGPVSEKDSSLRAAFQHCRSCAAHGSASPAPSMEHEPVSRHAHRCETGVLLAHWSPSSTTRSENCVTS